jgi:DNA modification methylase
MRNLQIEQTPINAFRPRDRNARTHSKSQIRQIRESILRFGFNNPILIDDDGHIIAGHGRVEAAKGLNITTVPAVRLSHLNETEKRAYVIADNRLAEKAGWDPEILAIELQGLIDIGFDVELTGFETPEIDLILEEFHDVSRQSLTPDDQIPDPTSGPTISRLNDLWLLGAHRLLCGDARSAAAYAKLLGGQTADMVFTDPPYNVRIDGHVSGLGRVRHSEFAMASGEMTEPDFTSFLATTLGLTAKASRDGALQYVCMDWRHLAEILSAGRKAYDQLLNLCVWNKDNGGMGSFYRSKHELVFVFKVGNATHINNVELGRHGRNRTNVWDYAGVNTFRAGRLDDLTMHPTVKPVALVADAIKDASRRSDLVLDPFAGSGTTIIAAEKTGRRAHAMEIDPKYVDVIIRRWQALTGKEAVLEATTTSFEDTLEHRQRESTTEPNAQLHPTPQQEHQS